MSDSHRRLDDQYRVTGLTDLAVSPDGDRIAYVTSEFDARANERLSSLFVVPSDGSRDPHRLSRASTVSAPQWSPDGGKLAVLATREEDAALRAANDDPDEEEEEEESPETQLWSFDIERGGDARQVTMFDEGAREFDWGPEGERVVVTARDPTEEQQAYLDQREEDGPVEVTRLQHKYDGQGWLDDVTSYLFVVDVDSREATRIDEAYGGGAREPATGLSPAWSPDGDRIAFLSTRAERPDDVTYSDLYTIRPDGTGLEKVTDSSLAVDGGTWGPTGRHLAFPGSDKDNAYDPTKLHVADIEADEFWAVSASIDRPLSRGGAFDWTDDDTLLGLIGDEGQTRLVRFNAHEDDPERVYERQGALEDLASIAVNGGTVAMHISGPHESPNAHSLAVEAIDDGETDPERLTDLNGDLLEDYDEPETRWVEFESDGQPIEGLVYFPPGHDPEDGNVPLITTIHGGPISYDRPGFNYDYTFWTDRGYALLRVNYRGSASYGGEFSRAIEGDWGHWEPADVIAGIDYVVDEGWINPDRVFVTGFSYGGAQTAYVLSQSDVAAAGAAEHGIYDRYAYFGTGDSHNRMQRDFGLPWDEEETYRGISSITDVGEIDAPLLVTAGGQDWRCPPTQSEQLYVSVAKQGVDSKLVVYEDEHHNIGEPDRAVHRLTELTEWFEDHDPATE
ncbi:MULTISPECIES: S9 family peptidase [Halolamina]|uniref:Dipeptidyl aminopeptidase/acylaminoacyl peptidase n=1 Tax=Halolamina pelagica TaxID=699431 RepID=A0A1I5VYD0_9EURY|nr:MULTISPECIES: S9 family peptidase [Halolamina]NHX37532.1 S9 family peptidase [Halolamina sp. R1-12]SFQ12016.1 Dipeptidyl aminopeptidase/acylaminoacyl peptidase [Halolamina pelagica]